MLDPPSGRVPRARPPLSSGDGHAGTARGGAGGAGGRRRGALPAAPLQRERLLPALPGEGRLAVAHGHQPRQLRGGKEERKGRDRPEC